MSKPTDLTSKAWNKAKELTVPKTGFGEKLDAYQAAKKKTEDLNTRNLKSFDAAAVALKAITQHVPVALAKCNKTLHKGTIEALGTYKALVDKEGSVLLAAEQKYRGYIDTFKHKRMVAAQEMAAIEKQMEAAGKKWTAAVKKAIAADKLKEAGELIKASNTEFEQITVAGNTALAKPRVNEVASETPHGDDRPDMAVFSGLIALQNEIAGTRNVARDEMFLLLKDAAAKKKA